MNSSLALASSENSSSSASEKVSPSLYGRYGFATTIIGTINLFLNIIGMHLVRKSKTIFKNLQEYIISLMACYFFIGLCFSTSPIVLWLSNSHNTVNIITPVVRYFFISSLLLTAGLSIDRLLSIKQPNFYTFRVTLNTCIWACVCIWFMSALYNILVHALFTFYPMGGLFDVRVYSSFMCIYFSCLFVYVGSSRSIVVCAKEHIRRENATQRRFGPKRDQMSLDTFRLSTFITTTSGLLFLLYLPSQLFALFTFIGPTVS